MDTYVGDVPRSFQLDAIKMCITSSLYLVPDPTPIVLFQNHELSIIPFVSHLLPAVYSLFVTGVD